jgi:hypothetical protein
MPYGPAQQLQGYLAAIEYTVFVGKAQAALILRARPAD